MFDPFRSEDNLRCRPFFRRFSQAFIAISSAVLGHFTVPASAHWVTTVNVTETPTDPQAYETTSVPHRQEIRTVDLDMEFISFSAKSIFVKEGETIRFVIRNTSPITHDFTIGSSAIQEGRRAVIGEMKDAETLDIEEGDSVRYDAPNAVLILPGETKELVWTFTKTQRFEFGCNLPGHYELGMKGKFRVRPAIDHTVAFAAADRHPEKQVAMPVERAMSIEPTVTRKLPIEFPVSRKIDFPTINRSSTNLFEVPIKLLLPDEAAKPKATSPERPSQQFVQGALRRHLEAAKARRREILRKHGRGLSES